jgi:hygromycin-B 7''-O-kinase
VLPPFADYAAFDPFHDDAAAWHDVIAEIAAAHSRAPITQALDGTVLVALVGRELVVKLYPPFLADHAAYERAALAIVHGKTGVPTPAIVATGERDGWPYVVMTQLHGRALRDAWPAYDERARRDVLAQIGALAAEVHALPPPAAPAWDDFIARQRAGCVARQTKTALPAHLLAEVDAFVAGPVPDGAVLLTGEYTPMNLLVDGVTLSGMFDFGDGLVGAREYDWLGPLVFLAAGDRARREAFLAGYGATDLDRTVMLRLLLLHKYSSLRAQIAAPGWQDARDLEALAAYVWP